MRNLLHEPLAHFFLLGAALFAVFAWTNRDASPAGNVIVIDENRIADLTARYERTWQRPPTAADLQGLVDAWIKEEILYREGLAMGLDRDDPVVRRRIAQKVDFLADGLVPEAPGDTESRAWFRANIEKYMVPARYSIQQAYFDPERHGRRLDAVIEAALEPLDDGGGQPAGDSTMLPARLEDVELQQIERVFGRDFASSIPELPPGEWTGPVDSAYGRHLVRVDRRTAGRTPPFDEVRGMVERDLLRARSEEAGEAFYQALRDSYTIRFEDASVMGDVTASR